MSSSRGNLTMSTAQPWMGASLLLIGLLSAALSLVFLSSMFSRRPLHTFHNLSAASLLCALLSATVYLLCATLIFLDVNTVQQISPSTQPLPLFTGALQVYSELSLITLHAISTTNRLVAIAFPFKYQRWFSSTNTNKMILISFLLPLPFLFLLTIGKGSCVNAFDATRLFWLRERSICQYSLAMAECAMSYIVTTFSFFIDIYCVLKLKFSKQASLRKLARTEMKYAVQTMIVGVTFWVCTLSYYSVGVRPESGATVMFLSSSVKTLSSILVGLIICGLNWQFISRARPVGSNSHTPMSGGGKVRSGWQES